ncbi:MAG: hypothetical protein ACREV6_15145 [Clostridium sp.]|uniref:hypothetical protein n=1 Tax=Clostridium sp. TaxID=1506 RepID=UPI003D6D7FBD
MVKYLKIFFGILIILLLSVLGLINLGFINSSDYFIPNKNLDDIHIGVVQSTQNDNIGYISFYDKSFNFKYEKKLEFGDMGDSTRVPYLSDDNFYTVPLGIGNRKDLKTIVKFDLKTGKYKTFKINQPAVLMFTVNKNDVYTTNTINFDGYISKCDTITGSLQEWKKHGVIISGLKCYDDILYAWGTLNENNIDNPYLFVFETKELKMIKQIPLKECGTQQLDSYKIGDYIYFTNNLDTKGSDSSKTLSKFNIITNEIQNIELRETNPFQIIEHNNKLYITHCNPLTANKNKITVFDPKTGNQQLFEMKNPLVQTIKYKNYLYSQDMHNLYVYNLNTLELLKSININKERKSSLIPKHFYIGGMFVK